MPDEKNLRRLNRDGVSTLAQISAFLGGLFFSALLLLIQQKAEYQFFINPVLPITALQLIVIPLTISIILFVFSSFFMGIACTYINENSFWSLSNSALIPFIFGLVSFFISLCVVLLLADIFAGIIGALLSILLIYWWGTKVKI